MVKTRSGGSNADLLFDQWDNYKNIFGSDSFTLIKLTQVLNSAGRIESSTETSSTISGDLQWDNKIMKEYISLGIAVEGDGIFYCKGDESVEVHDFIEYKSVRYELTKQVEGETVEDNVIYIGFIARRIPDA